MSILKFKSVAEVIEKEVEIGDGHGNVIAIPSKGVSDYKEYKQVMGRFLKVQNNPALAAGIEIDVVLCCLRYRFSIESKVQDDDILQLENGQLMNTVFIKRLFEFFTQELGIEGLSQKQSASTMEDATPYLDEKPLPLMIDKKK
ncbi:MAG: hypothetical protein EAZ18_00190 [Oscillatoriales cyanobacterium]|nr:MAG: hypothetical protein EAZ18_00190 [Oscillatoriales cyanobacterium]